MRLETTDTQTSARIVECGEDPDLSLTILSTNYVSFCKSRHYLQNFLQISSLSANYVSSCKSSRLFLQILQIQLLRLFLPVNVSFCKLAINHRAFWQKMNKKNQKFYGSWSRCMGLPQ